MTNRGTFYLIPNSLGSEGLSHTIPQGNAERLKNINLYLVEKPKIARRLLVDMGLKEEMNNAEMHSISHDIDKDLIQQFENTLKEGKEVGLISDAGCPAVADPGYSLVQRAHVMNAKVVPLVGPSSIILGLMASGFNGQQFAFHGYLPKDIRDRQNRIKGLEQKVYQKDETQLFIETPYRNMHLLEDLLKVCQKNTKICLAVDLTTENEWIKVDTVENWKKNKPDINKKQCLFLIYK